jgi:aspartyl-tRNA(Asn)/glutamyl-tRNA(Gln) amidotransferase subunit A
MNLEQKLCHISVKELSKKIENLEISPVELAESCLIRIKELDRLFNTFITIANENEIYENARNAERDIKLGYYKSPLHGIPFSVKDNFFVKNLRCTAGSRILSSYIPSYDASIVKRMKKSGAILIGKNNLNEFASGITGANQFYGNSRNPWDILRISGGSSGGSAAAVSSRMIPISLGTDTGGSVRVPSSLCGVVGLKPTYGLVSRHGVVPLSPSLDHVGFMSKSVWDIAAVLEYTAGWDPLDLTTVQREKVAYTKIIEKPTVEPISVGIPSSYFMKYLDPEVKNCFYNFLDRLRPLVSKIYDIKLYNTERYFETWKKIRLAETSEIHMYGWNAQMQDYSREVRKLLIDGIRVLAYDYLNSKKIIGEIRAEFSRRLSSGCFTIIIIPTTIITAPLFSELVKIKVNDNVLRTRDALLRNTVLFNSIGVPAISIPIGLTSKNLPVGAQLIGPEFEEGKILSFAYSYEQQNRDINKLMLPIH